MEALVSVLKKKNQKGNRRKGTRNGGSRKRRNVKSPAREARLRQHHSPFRQKIPKP